MNENKKVKTLSPKIDVVFQALFGEVGSERITKRFLESILDEKIEKIDLSKNLILRREKQSDKLGVLDVIAKIDGKETCNIEMQIANQDAIIERILFYWGKIYTKQIKKKEDYNTLEKTIEILIADFTIKGVEEVEYHTKWKIIEENERKIILTDKFELHILELPKIEGKDKEDELLDWLHFLKNPKSERVVEKMQKNEELKEAVEKLDGLSEDERMERIAELRQKAIMDEKAIYRKGINDGVEKVVVKLLQEKVDIEIIKKATGLEKDEIEKIAKENKL